MQLLAAHVPLLLLIDLAGAPSVPAAPASAYDWGPGRGQLWVSPWALDPI
jgi:hypothetical protein